MKTPKERFVSEDQQGKKLKIAIIGDAMLDEYFQVTANRISPEYPIPVELSEDDHPILVRPGGAANVAYQMMNWNIDATLFCMADEEALKRFEEFQIKVFSVESDNIPRKRRFYDKKFPLRRWDVEKNFGTPELRDRLFIKACVEWEKNKPDIVIVSDYNKGTFNYKNDSEPWFASRIIELCKKINVPVVVDPKTGPLEQWRGCNVLKLNTVEAKHYSGKEEWREQMDFINEVLSDSNIIITRGVNGAVASDFWEYEPEAVSKDEVNTECVIGAGDCFVVFYSMALARGFSTEDAISIAYEAGAIYVRQRHNLPVHPCQLLGSKFIDPNYLVNRNFTLSFTNGCFDGGLTSGHIECIKFAKQKADKLVVALNSDESITRLKGKDRPLMKLESRVKIVSSLLFVDFVVVFDEDTPLNLINLLKPDVIIKGGDYKQEEVVGFGIAEVCICPLYDGDSTTQKLHKLEKL